MMVAMFRRRKPEPVYVVIERPRRRWGWLRDAMRGPTGWVFAILGSLIVFTLLTFLFGRSP
jgi:hypothetical protein